MHQTYPYAPSRVPESARLQRHSPIHCGLYYPATLHLLVNTFGADVNATTRSNTTSLDLSNTTPLDLCLSYQWSSIKASILILLDAGAHVRSTYPAWIHAYAAARLHALGQRRDAAVALYCALRAHTHIPRDVLRVLARTLLALDWRAWRSE